MLIIPVSIVPVSVIFWDLFSIDSAKTKNRPTIKEEKTNNDSKTQHCKYIIEQHEPADQMDYPEELAGPVPQ